MFVRNPIPELDEVERTLFLSVDDLKQRSQALQQEAPSASAVVAASADAAPASVPAPPLTDAASFAQAVRPSLMRRLTRSIAAVSWARKATLVVLPLLIGLLLYKPVFRNQPPRAKTPLAQAPARAARASSAARPHSKPAAAAPTPRPTRQAPPGSSLERAAVDSLAAGNYPQALDIYRSLATANPSRTAYATAVKVLERQQGAAAP
jgi:hypothetical protein